jgi:hypothetical protein
MLKLLLPALAASTFAFAMPASAQVHVHGSDRGVGVHVHSGGGGYRSGYRSYARHGCRQVTSRTVRPNGTVVVRKRTVCR